MIGTKQQNQTQMARERKNVLKKTQLTLCTMMISYRCGDSKHDTLYTNINIAISFQKITRSYTEMATYLSKVTNAHGAYAIIHSHPFMFVCVLQFCKLKHKYQTRCYYID